MPPEDDSSSHGYVVLPEQTRSPWWSLGRRLLLGVGIIAFTVMLVYVDRDGYRDNNDPPALPASNLIDSIYYTTVTLSTTGYGDIAPVSSGARLVNAFVITPLRIAFLVLLIGTTLEVLATQGRRLIRIARWRRHMSDHRRDRRIRHQGPQRGRHAGQQRHRPRLHRGRRQGRRGGLGRPRRRAGGRHRRRDPQRRPPAGRGRAGEPGDHHHRPRRLQRALRPDRAPAQPRRLHRRVGPRARERAA